MQDRTCTLDGCERPIHCLGWCSMHYTRWRRLGSPGEAAPRISSRDASIYARVERIGWTVKESGCWETMTARDSNGYGIVKTPSNGNADDRRHVSAHRVVFEHHHGALSPGEVVRHRCDNPPCVNPDHLLRGTQADNVADMWQRDRGARGLRHPNARLSAEEVATIRAKYAAGNLRHIDLANEFAVSREHIGNVIRGKRRATS